MYETHANQNWNFMMANRRKLDEFFVGKSGITSLISRSSFILLSKKISAETFVMNSYLRMKKMLLSLFR